MATCQGRTKDGRQCSRNVKDEALYCWQHEPVLELNTLSVTMSSDTAPLDLREVLKHRLTLGEFKTLGDRMYDEVSRFVWKLIRGPATVSLWYNAIVLALVHLLIGYLLLGLDGINALQEYVLIGFPTVGLAHMGVVLYTVQYRALLSMVRDYLVDAIVSPADLVDLEHWLAGACSRKYAVAFSLTYGVMAGLYFTALLIMTRGSNVGVGLTIAICLSLSVYGISLYYLLALAVLPFRLSRYQLKLYAIKPSSSELVARLSDILSNSVLLIAIYAALITLLVAYLGWLTAVGLISLLFAWVPLIGLFVANQTALSRIISRAKWKTLNEVQAKIEKIHSEENLIEKEMVEAINRLMDYHDRIEATRDSALDLRALLNFVNSLLLPLLAFLLANLNKIVALFQ